jgi:CDP-diacylglycerol--glycerol-3-phosphate 3-phosphatidyltransferase
VIAIARAGGRALAASAGVQNLPPAGPISASIFRRSALLADLATGPNLVTLSRLALVLGVFVAYAMDAYAVGLGLGVLAGASDYVDGWLARRTGQVTRLGEILDQVCDVALELAFLVFAISLGAVPVALLVPYVLREIWVVSLRRYSIELGENIPSRLSGKLKASFVGWSMVPLLIGAVRWTGALSPALVRFGRITLALGLGLGLVSGVEYTIAFVRIYERRARKRLDPADRPS